MKIIAVTNIKGGVGKTTTAVNLSYLCAASGRATLLWDLDPQGAATYTLRGEPLERASPKKLLSGKRQLPELILSTGYPGLDLLPADFSYRNFDVHLSERKRPTERLLKMSRSLRDVYSALFLDCAPGISLLSENVLRAADAIIVPLLPTPLSVRMLVQLRDFISRRGLGGLAAVAVLLDGRSPQVAAPRDHGKYARAVSHHARDRSAVLERDRTNEPAPRADTGLRAEQCGGADLCGTVGGGDGANGRTVAAAAAINRPAASTYFRCFARNSIVRRQAASRPLRRASRKAGSWSPRSH